MKFSYKWLKDYIKGNLPSAQKLAELLTAHSFEVETLTRKDNDFVLEIDVLPNRAHDCLAHLGVARESCVVTNAKFQIPDCKPKEDKKLKSENFIEVKVENKEDCSRYSAKAIFDVKVKPSPKWLRDRLNLCGLQTVNNIVDIANFVMLETGQPLHVFDLDKIKSVQIQNPKCKIQNKKKKIIIRRAKKGEKIDTLDDRTYKLDEDILLIADSEGPLAIAGIKGGKGAEIDKKTKNIIVEAVNFNQKIIRHASQKLKLRTDASWRFEQGLSPDLIDFAQQRAAFLIQKIAAGKLAQGLVGIYPKKVLPQKIQLDLNYIDRLLGIKISRKEVERILKNLGFKFQVSPKDKSTGQASFKFQVTVPTRRLDISLQEDLIEEIGRIYGYQQTPSIFPRAALQPSERNDEIFWEQATGDILKESGFSEVYNYSFWAEQEKEIFGIKDDEIAELANPVSVFSRYLRPTLILGLVKNVKENLKNFSEIKIFETGKVFKKAKSQKPKAKNVAEKKMLAGALARRGGREDGFYELKGTVDLFFQKLGIANIWYDEHKPTPEDSTKNIWHPERCAEIKTDGVEVGFLGEINPRINRSLGTAERIFVFDIDFEKLAKLASEEHEYRPISAYPAAVRDLAILVPQNTRVAEVLNVINAAGGSLVRDVDLFDIYHGGEIGEGKENFAFHIIYQAEDRTLSAPEIDRVHQKIVKALEENPAWEVRC